MSRGSPLNIASTYLRLRSDASIEPLAVDDTFWPRLMTGKLGTFHNEFLVSFYDFDSDWSTFEMHPNGDEIGCLLSGSVTILLELADGHEKVRYEEVRLDEAGAYAIIPKGTWHTARVHAPSRMLFITAGEGTESRDVIAP